MRNYCVLRESLATFSLVLCCGLSVEFSALRAFGADESSLTPLPFGCEVRYHFREHLRNAKPGEKQFSALSYEREALPLSRIVNSDGGSTRLVEGRVPHLPYRFQVRINQSGRTERGRLVVNVMDRAGKSVAGFPQSMPNALTSAGDTSRKEFEIPIGQTVKKKIERSLLAKGQVLTLVDLIIGADEDFLSADFPK